MINKNNVFNGLGDRMMNNMFRKVPDAVWDMMTGRMGILTSEGIATLEGTGDDAVIDINMLDDFAMRVPAFAQSTAVNTVKEGDLIYVNGSPKGWVIAVNKIAAKKAKKDGESDSPAKTKFQLMTPSGTTTTWTPPKKQMIGFESGVMVLRSLLNLFGGNETALTGIQTGMQEMLMMMTMMGKDADFESIMPFLLMSQLGGGSTGGGMFGGGMMQTMMLMNMFQGGGKTSFDFGAGFFDRQRV